MLVFHHTFNAATRYRKHDVVEYDGSSYPRRAMVRAFPAMLVGNFWPVAASLAFRASSALEVFVAAEVRRPNRHQRS
jgi:hypothetical protein